MWELDYKESWAPKNWCFWTTVVLEKTLESPLDCKEIQPVHPQGDQSWLFIGRTDVEAETPILWPPDAKNWLSWKDPDAGKDWGQEEEGTTEDKMVGWHHQLNGDEIEQTLGVGDGQGGLACCDSLGSKSQIWLSDWTDWLIHSYIYSITIYMKSESISHSDTSDSMDWSPPGFSVHGILQARILEWVAISFSRGSLRPRGQAQVSRIAGGFFTTWATSEANYIYSYTWDILSHMQLFFLVGQLCSTLLWPHWL